MCNLSCSSNHAKDFVLLITFDNFDYIKLGVIFDQWRYHLAFSSINQRIHSTKNYPGQGGQHDIFSEYKVYFPNCHVSPKQSDVVISD